MGASLSDLAMGGWLHSSSRDERADYGDSVVKRVTERLYAPA